MRAASRHIFAARNWTSGSSLIPSGCLLCDGQSQPRGRNQATSSLLRDSSCFLNLARRDKASEVQAVGVLVPFVQSSVCALPAYFVRCEKSYRGSRMSSRFLLPIPCWGSSPCGEADTPGSPNSSGSNASICEIFRGRGRRYWGILPLPSAFRRSTAAAFSISPRTDATLAQLRRSSGPRGP